MTIHPFRFPSQWTIGFLIFSVVFYVGGFVYGAQSYKELGGNMCQQALHRYTTTYRTSLEISPTPTGRVGKPRGTPFTLRWLRKHFYTLTKGLAERYSSISDFQDRISEGMFLSGVSLSEGDFEVQSKKIGNQASPSTTLDYWALRLRYAGSDNWLHQVDIVISPLNSKEILLTA